MDGLEIFYNLIKQNYDFNIGNAHSYLLCSNDSVLLMLIARLIVENDCGDMFYSPDVRIFPANDKAQSYTQNKSLDGLLSGMGDKLSVSDIEEITTTAATTPLQIKYKYYIIKNGETLNDSSSNKLLKTLEEPSKTVKIIILAQNEYAVLPTIRSRCRIITPPPINQQLLNQAAEQAYGGFDCGDALGDKGLVDKDSIAKGVNDKSLINKARALSDGSITRLVKAASGGFEAIEQAVFDTLLGMKNSLRQAEYAQKILKLKGELADVVNMLEFILSDVLRYQYGLKVCINYRASDIAAIANFYRTDTVIRLKPVIDRARQRIKLFGNANSVVDELLFSLLEVRQKSQV